MPPNLLRQIVVTGLRETVPAAQIGHRQTCLGFTQEANDLFLRKSFAHVQSLLKSGQTSNRVRTHRSYPKTSSSDQAQPCAATRSALLVSLFNALR